MTEAQGTDPVLIDLPMPIRTPRLLIRPWQTGDGVQLLEVKRESWPELGRWFQWAAGPVDVLTERGEEARVRRRAAEFILRTEVKRIGACSLSPGSYPCGDTLSYLQSSPSRKGSLFRQLGTW